ncbi:hypothetical protein CMV_027928, partial [Castanea mollissima]
MSTSKSFRNEVLESQKTVSPGGDGSEKGSLFLDRPAASSSISSCSNISPDDTRALIVSTCYEVSGGHGGEIESQQTVLSMASIAPGADKADKGSLAVDNIRQDDSGKAAEKISNNCIGDAKLQQANVAGVVEEDLDSMQKVGGIQEITEALDTDLEKGIFTGPELDLCSQRIANTLSPTQAPARNRWQRIVSMLRDRKLSESGKGSVSLDNVSPNDTREADLKISSASAQVSISVNGENDNCGIQIIAEPLGTDLQKGIPGLKQDPCTQHIDIANSSPSLTQAPALGFFISLLKTCNDWIIFLLFVYAMLLLGFGIVMKSPKDWHKGVITILFIMVLVVIHSLRELWLERSRQMSRRQNTSEMHQVEVEVIRGGRSQKVSISDVLLGDIVCLEKKSLVLADGLLVSGGYINLDDDLDSIINNEKPISVLWS